MEDLYGWLLHLFWYVISTIDYYFEGTYTQQILSVAWKLFSQLWYYILLGALAASLLTRFLPQDKISKFLKNKGSLTIFTAAFIGILSPMPTFAVIPFVVGLLAIRVTPGPLIAFLICSPLINPSLFLITAGAMGVKMALARTFSALLLGISAGFMTKVLAKFKAIDFTDTKTPTHQNISLEKPQPLWKEFEKMTFFISKYFLLSIFVAGFVQTFLSPSWISSLLGGKFSVFVAVAAGIPLYACGGGSIPVIEVLTQMGMSQGAALAFFLSGPATKLSTILSMYTAFKTKILTLYLTVTLCGASISGYLYSFISSIQ